MKTINLRDFYPWNIHSEYMEIFYDVTDELFEDRLHRKVHDQYMKRNKVYNCGFDSRLELCSCQN